MVLKIRATLLGEHVHAAMYASPVEGNLAHVGTLQFRRPEYDRFMNTLRFGVLPEVMPFEPAEQPVTSLIVESKLDADATKHERTEFSRD